MLGVVLFLAALLAHLGRGWPEIVVRLAPAASRARPGTLTLRPAAVLVALTVAAGMLVALGLVAPSLLGDPWLARPFRLTGRFNLVSWYASSLWLVAAGLALAGVQLAAAPRGWRLLALGFLALSLDAVAGLTDRAAEVLGRTSR